MSESRPLWGGRFQKPPAPEAAALTASLSFDRRLWAEDILATRAHARGLERAGLLTTEERESVEAALDEALALFEQESFQFDRSDEDIHSAVERFLVERLGDVGAKIHAGRSRNDLVVTDLRLWLKKTIPTIARGIHELQGALCRQAHMHSETLAPGYTHLQPAQPVLLPHLLLAHAFAFARDFERMVAAYRRADTSTLGAAAFAGSTLPLDAKAVADELGFSKVFDNAADAVSDRDFALEFLAAAAILGVHLSRLAEEIVLFATREFAYIEIDDAFATGSSIMPQKKNPDVAELSRAKSARITADLVHLLGAMKGLPLSYNRDLQEDKEPVFDAADTLTLTLHALKGLTATLSFHRERLAEASGSGESLATDLAEALVSEGLPFRRAHEMVGELVAAAGRLGKGLAQLSSEELASHGIDPKLSKALDPWTAVKGRRTHGGTSPERVAEQLARIESVLENQEHWLSFHRD